MHAGVWPVTVLTVLVDAAGTDGDLHSRGGWVRIPARMSRMQWTYCRSFTSMVARTHTHYR